MLPTRFSVLQNKFGIRDGEELDYVEREFVSRRSVGRVPSGRFDLAHLKAIHRQTGTAPEVVAAYVEGAEYAAALQRRGVSLEEVKLGAELPLFDAPAATVPASGFETQRDTDVVARAGGETWQPRSAQVIIKDIGPYLEIDAQYSWWGLDPFAAPFIINDGWGMEFQVDFYTTNRGVFGDENMPNYGQRPYCGVIGDQFKDWAAASNRPFNWFGWVISGTSTVLAPGGVGLYGDYNDLSDPCTVSSISVGAADPGAIPDTAGGTEELRITMYPSKGMDATSVVGSIVQPVNRHWCEVNPTMPLTDCMGVTPGTYPGPGPAGSRLVLNDGKGWRAPNLCWYSGNFGIDPSSQFSCSGDDL